MGWKLHRMNTKETSWVQRKLHRGEEVYLAKTKIPASVGAIPSRADLAFADFVLASWLEAAVVFQVLAGGIGVRVVGVDSGGGGEGRLMAWGTSAAVLLYTRQLLVEVVLKLKAEILGLQLFVLELHLVDSLVVLDDSLLHLKASG